MRASSWSDIASSLPVRKISSSYPFVPFSSTIAATLRGQ